MPREKRQVTMGLITEDPNIKTGKKKLKFATNINILGRSGTTTSSSLSKKLLNNNNNNKNNNNNNNNGHSSMVFNKGFGQHILKNPLVIAAIIEKASVKSTDTILEIGPGTGNLTEKLLLSAKKVIAIELDPRMCSELTKRFQNTPLASKLEVLKGNCLDFDFPYFDKCVANVPYAISSALIFKLLKKPDFKCAVLMFQREFALRVCAQPNSDNYCRLAVNSQLLARCSHLMKISKNSFTPPPKVESSVIRLDPRHPPPPIDFDEWDGLVKLIFNRKNRKVSSIFKTKTTRRELYVCYINYIKSEGGDADSVAVGFDIFNNIIDSILQGEDYINIFNRRGKSLTIGEIAILLSVCNNNGIHFV